MTAIQNLLLASIFVFGACSTWAETPHPEVTWTLSYEIPDVTCVKPRLRKSNEVAGRDIRRKRRLARYLNCVKQYQTGLIKDHQRIVAAAEHGLTKDQGLAFVDVLKKIEARLESVNSDSAVSPDWLELQQLTIGNRSSI